MRKLLSKIEPYKDLLIFVVALLGANLVWKLLIRGDESGDIVTLLGYDISNVFNQSVAHIAMLVAWLIEPIRPTFYFQEPASLCFENGISVHVVWSCSAIKQSFIWLVIMSVTRGAWRHKAWFIPLGLICIYLFNIFRIFLITISMENHPDYFEVLHTYILKYLFYGMIFLLWLGWNKRWERFGKV